MTRVVLQSLISLANRCHLHSRGHLSGRCNPSTYRLHRSARRKTASKRVSTSALEPNTASSYNFGDRVLQDGSFGEDVLELQRYLHDQGYFPRLRETPAGYTGYFGDLTTEALTAWQEDCHLIADGRFGQSARQAVIRQQEESLLEQSRKQQLVQHEPVQALQIKEGLTPIQAGGILFLLGGVMVFAYQAWTWRRRGDQESNLIHDSHDERKHHRGKWQGTLSSDRSHAHASSSTPSQRPRSPGGYVSLPSLNPQPPSPLLHPTPDPTLDFSDAAGPAVSLEGYPRYNPQWGTGLAEPNPSSSSGLGRREPSERAKSVMARPGTPAYKATAAAAARKPSTPREPTGYTKKITRKEAEQARAAYSKRPRSPDPNAMPDSIQTPPPLKPELDPSAKSWIQIAVGQRGPKQSKTEGKSAANDSRAGQNGRPQGNMGRSYQQQREPGSPGSGIAQVLSVDEERLVDDRISRNTQSGSSNGVDGNSQTGSKTGSGNQARSTGKQTGGVSLFGSYKAPIKRD